MQMEHFSNKHWNYAKDITNAKIYVTAYFKLT